MIKAYGDQGLFEKIEEILKQMESEGIKHNVMTW